MPQTGLQHFVFLIFHPAFTIPRRLRRLQLDVLATPLPALGLTRPVILVLPVPARLGGDLVRALDPELPRDEDLLDFLRNNWPEHRDRGQDTRQSVFRLAKNEYPGELERQIVGRAILVQNLVCSEAQASYYINADGPRVSLYAPRMGRVTSTGSYLLTRSRSRIKPGARSWCSAGYRSGREEESEG